MLSQTGGHGDTAAPSNHPRLSACGIDTTGFAHVADGPDAVRRAAREELKGGADQIKVMAGGGVASPNDPIDMTQYTEAELRAAVEEAAARRTYVMAHAYIPESIVRAARAGVRSIEHGNLLDAESARVMAEHGCFLVPTLVTYDQIAERARSSASRRRACASSTPCSAPARWRSSTPSTPACASASAPTCSARPTTAQSKELRLRAEVQSPLDVLRSATLVNAELLGRAGELGVIAPGAAADLLLVDGDPLADLDVLAGQGERIDLIVRGGEIVHDAVR